MDVFQRANRFITPFHHQILPYLALSLLTIWPYRKSKNSSQSSDSNTAAILDSRGIPTYI